MTTAENCEKVMRLIHKAAMEGHKITIWVDDESEDSFFVVESPQKMCLLAYPNPHFDHLMNELAKGL